MKEFHTKKSLGQNFISDKSLIWDIVDACGCTKDESIMEIGPGEGALTEALIESCGHVTAVEIDQRLVPLLRAKFGMCSNFELINADFLSLDLSQIKVDRMIGNLPYYITTPILMKVLESRIPIKSFTVMVQKEVAERLAAEPGSRSYGAISAAVQYYSEIQYVRTVDRSLFRPVPKVDSAVINLKIRENPLVSPIDESLFFEVIKQSFSQRRKTLANSLCGIRGLDKSATLSLLEGCGIESNRRAETLSLAEFAAIADALSRRQNN